MIDLHAHYLPGIDDGPKELEQSLEMARLAAADGITDATVTPHHLNGRYRTDAATVRAALAELQAAVADAAIALRLHPGSEVHLTPELPQAVADGSAMTVADRGRAVLVEPPVHHLPVGMEAILSECLVQGVTPIIAHPERSRPLQQDIAPVRRWVEMGCLVQVTAQSFTGRFGHSARDAAAAMLAEGLVHVLASDGHRPYGRTPCIGEGRAVVAEWLGEAVAAEITEVIPAALLAGEAPERKRLRRLVAEAVEARRPRPSWWRRLLGAR
ncbi:tyrosine-protein phosphatase [Arhodomonas sp. SL1]|uniref:tyrosine-protein phosphatase n=1 Tax=Arhodomonas sp. SL1 TaxID=3425691 RepID=UPI003F883EBE